MTEPTYCRKCGAGPFLTVDAGREHLRNAHPRSVARVEGTLNDALNRRGDMRLAHFISQAVYEWRHRRRDVFDEMYSMTDEQLVEACNDLADSMARQAWRDRQRSEAKRE